MIQRFQIEDLIAQDSSGVVFQARDLETGNVVAVRRFFPFGPDGGGLNVEEQAAYNVAIARLAGLSHPALRSVVCGGCDPIDGMPFIATEWVEGDTLGDLLQRGPLETDVAVRLISQALEVSELVSHIFAEEAVWVETELQTIVVGNEESGRGVTFWICPLKWLGTDDHSRRLESIVGLTETVMGWQGCLVNDHAGRGLGGWVKWLAQSAGTTSLFEAREVLASSVGAEPPPPVDSLVVRAATRPMVGPKVSIKSDSSKTPLIAALTLSIVVAAMGAWMWTRNPAADAPLDLPITLPKLAHEQPPVSVSAESTTPGKVRARPQSDEDLELAAVNRRAAELYELAKEQTEKTEAAIASQQSAATQNGDVIRWDAYELLKQSDGKKVTVGGQVIGVEPSNSKKTYYLLFAPEEDRKALRAGMTKGSLTDEEVEESLKSFVNRNVRITGNLGFNGTQPEISFKQASDIKIME